MWQSNNAVEPNKNLVVGHILSKRHKEPKISVSIMKHFNEPVKMTQEQSGLLSRVNLHDTHLDQIQLKDYSDQVNESNFEERRHLQFGEAFN